MGLGSGKEVASTLCSQSTSSAVDATPRASPSEVFAAQPPPPVVATDQTLIRQVRAELERSPTTMLPKLQEIVKAQEKLSDSREVSLQVDAIRGQENRAALTARRVEGQPCGLVNLGNTCYANAILQCLFRMPAFTDALVTFDAAAARKRCAPEKDKLDAAAQSAAEAHARAVEAALVLREAEARRVDPSLTVEQHGKVMTLRDMLGAAWSEEALVYALRKFEWNTADTINAHFSDMLVLPDHLDPAKGGAVAAAAAQPTRAGASADGAAAAEDEGGAAASSAQLQLEAAIAAESDAATALATARRKAAQWDRDVTITQRLQELFGAMSCATRGAVDPNDVLGGAEVRVSGIPHTFPGATEFCGAYKHEGYANDRPLYVKQHELVDTGADARTDAGAASGSPCEADAAVPRAALPEETSARVLYRHSKAWLFTYMEQMKRYCHDEEYKCNVRSTSPICTTPFELNLEWDVWDRASNSYKLGNTADAVAVAVERAEGEGAARGAVGCGGHGLLDLLGVNVKERDAPNLFFCNLVGAVRRATISTVASADGGRGSGGAVSPMSAPRDGESDSDSDGAAAAIAARRKQPRSVSFCDDIAPGPGASSASSPLHFVRILLTI
jgi:hypothetical protein